MKKTITFLLMVVLFHSFGFGATRYLVQLDGSDATQAKWRSIQEGEVLVDLVAAGQNLQTWYASISSQIASGDSIWIATGTYKISSPLVIVDYTRIFGGFLGTETSVAERQKGDLPWIFTNPTIIDGQTKSANILKCAVSRQGVLYNGLTIKGSNGGAGLLLRSTSTKALTCKAEYCIVEDNVGGATGKGGGIQMYSGGCVSNCLVRNNTGYSGGGIGAHAITTSTSVVENCVLTNNKNIEGGSGSAIYVENSNKFTVKNCLTYDNESSTAIVVGTTTSTNGGEVFCNLTVAENKVKGFYAKSTVKAPTIYNSVFWGVNADSTIICEVANVSNGVIKISNCAIVNSPSESWAEGSYINSFKVSLDNSGYDAGINYVRFQNPQTNSFMPTKNSALLDKGIYVENISPETDLLGTIRPSESAIDLGCFEADADNLLVLPTQNNQVLSDMAIIQIIDHTLFVSGMQLPTIVSVFDIAGKLVTTCITDTNYSQKLSAGLYIVKIQQLDKIQTRKILSL